MRRPTRILAAFVTAAAVATTPLQALAIDENAAESAGDFGPDVDTWTAFVDIAVLRPLGITRLLVGSLVALPFSTVINGLAWPIDRDMKGTAFTDDWDKYVVEPWEYTFEREVGDSLSGV